MSVKIAIIGLGTVGGGVWQILQENKHLVNSRAGTEVEVKKVCDINPRAAGDLNIPSGVFTTDYREILNDPEISLVVVLTGSVDIGFDIISKCFNRNKHVVTANKALLAKKWKDIFSLSREKSCLIYFEAAVGSGVPVIQGINEGLAANRINKVKGILNGTSNYILSKMSRENRSLKQALDEAIEAGFAEPDSSADIDGFDAAHKICVLANIISPRPVDFNDIYVEGIGGVKQEDISFAADMFNFKLKHLCVMKKTDSGIDVRVHPAFLLPEDMLSSVNYENNAVLVDASNAGEVMFYGKGAGRFPAASAVVSDLLYVAQKINYGIAGKIPFVHTQAQGPPAQLRDIDEIEFQYYVRFTTVDKAGVLSSLSGILGRHGVSIASCFQKGRSRAENVPIVMITHRAREGAFKNALKEIDSRDIIKKESVFIRIESEKEIY
ncbi:MAG: homoserine dehydrogenase [Elusimicrobiota bacterium]